MRKIISLLLVVAMMLSFSVTAIAKNELERKADVYVTGTVAKGEIDEDATSEVYSFTMLKPGKIEFDVTADMRRAYFYMYNEEGNSVYSAHLTWNDTTEQINWQNEVYVNAGKYYFEIKRDGYDGEYRITLKETSIYETFSEVVGGSNNTTKTANEINCGTEYVGAITQDDWDDVYKFELTSSGVLNLDFVAGLRSAYIYVHDENGNSVYSTSQNWNDVIEQINYNSDYFLNKGVYYLSIKRDSGYGEYKLKLNFTTASESFSELQEGSNNKVSDAEAIVVNQKYNGFLSYNDDKDVYLLNVNEPKLTFNVVGSGMYSIEAKVFDVKGNTVVSQSIYKNENTGNVIFEREIELEPGTYYVEMSRGSGYGTFTMWFTNGGNVLEPVPSDSAINVKLNGKYVVFDQPPVLEDGRTLVPLRAIFEALGATVEWDGATQTVTATKDGVTIKLQIGSNIMYIGEAQKTLDVSAKLISSRTLVPVRAISESFGCDVGWDGGNRVVIIND